MHAPVMCRVNSKSGWSGWTRMLASCADADPAKNATIAAINSAWGFKDCSFRCSTRSEPAVEHQRRTGDEARLVARQVGVESRDFFGLGDSPDRVTLPQHRPIRFRIARRFGRHLNERRVD